MWEMCVPLTQIQILIKIRAFHVFAEKYFTTQLFEFFLWK